MSSARMALVCRRFLRLFKGIPGFHNPVKTFKTACIPLFRGDDAISSGSSKCPGWFVIPFDKIYFFLGMLIGMMMRSACLTARDSTSVSVSAKKYIYMNVIYCIFCSLGSLHISLRNSLRIDETSYLVLYYS